MAGVAIDVDWSVLVIVWLITWSLGDQALPASAKGYTTAWYWGVALLAAVAFVGGIAAHELAHSVVARRRGVHVTDIRLWVLGGIATITSEPETPRDDLAIAVAGPAASAGIGAGALAIAWTLRAFDVAPLARSAVLWLGSINVLLAVFNLVPAAPLDGGRVLRAWLWRRHGDRERAAVQAAGAGKVFAASLIAVGLVVLAAGAVVEGVWLAFLGWFVLGAAHTEELQTVLRHDLAGLVVDDVMSRDPVTVPSWSSVAEVLETFVLRHRCSAFPVTDDDGHLRGLVSLDDVRGVATERRAHTPVLDVAVPSERVVVVEPGTPVLDVVVRLGTVGARRALVCTGAAQRPVGIVTATDISRAVQFAHLGIVSGDDDHRKRAVVRDLVAHRTEDERLDATQTSSPQHH